MYDFNLIIKISESEFKVLKGTRFSDTVVAPVYRVRFMTGADHIRLDAKILQFYSVAYLSPYHQKAIEAP